MTSRRDFLRGAGALSSAAVASSPGLAHALGLRQAAISESFTFPEWRSAMAAQAASGHPADAAFWQAFEGAAAPVAAPGGDLTVLTLPAPGVEPFGADRARALAALANERLAETVRSSKGRLAGLATISAFDPQAARQAEYAVTRLGLAGLSLGANRGLRLDDKSLWPVYEFAAAARAPLYLPAGYAALAGDAPYRAVGDEGVIAGASAQSAAHATQLIFGGVLDAFPTLNVVLARLGEGTPYWHGQLIDTHAAMTTAGLRTPQQSPETYFRRNIRLTTADMETPAALRFCDVMLADGRVVAAGDAVSTQRHAALRDAGVNVRRIAGVDAATLVRLA